MELETASAGGTTVVACHGRLNMSTAPRLTQAVDDAIAQGHAKVVVDLAGTTFVDSSGLGALVSGLKKARQAGGDLRIAAPGEQVGTVLSLTNLDRVLKPYPSVEEARHSW